MNNSSIQIEVESLRLKTKNLTILYVEDDKELREITSILLNKIFYNIDVAVDGQEGLNKYLDNKYDIVITDILMPNMDGLEFISNIRKHNDKQEIIITSAYTDLSYLMESIKLGVTGYLIKPLEFNKILKVISQSVDKIYAFHEVERYQTKLEDMVEKRTEELIELQDQQIINYKYAIKSLVKMIERRDTYTGGHSERVAKYSRDIAKELGYNKKDCDLIYQAGIVHDIGKVMTPDSILLKPGKLTEDEYSLIKDHVTIGYEILSDVPMYKDLVDIVYSHHEDYDGNGYPRSLKGEEIPIFARIMAIADTFDAMTTSRIYKSRKEVSEAIEELKELSGIKYDPNLIESAIIVFKKVDINQSIDQKPKSHIDDERFAYFFKDPLTRVYNHYYLDFILHKNMDKKNFFCFNMIYIKNFTSYNKKYGWNEGDIFLSEFASYLQSTFKSSQIFRIFGDDFLLLNDIHQEIDIDKINNISLLIKSNIQCELKHIDVKENNINSCKDLQDL